MEFNNCMVKGMPTILREANYFNTLKRYMDCDGMRLVRISKHDEKFVGCEERCAYEII